MPATEIMSNVPIAPQTDWRSQWAAIRRVQRQIEDGTEHGHDPKSPQPRNPKAVYITSEDIPMKAIVGGRIFEVDSEIAFMGRCGRARASRKSIRSATPRLMP